MLILVLGSSLKFNDISGNLTTPVRLFQLLFNSNLCLITYTLNLSYEILLQFFLSVKYILPFTFTTNFKITGFLQNIQSYHMPSMNDMDKTCNFSHPEILSVSQKNHIKSAYRGVKCSYESLTPRQHFPRNILPPRRDYPKSMIFLFLGQILVHRFQPMFNHHRQCIRLKSCTRNLHMC